MRAPLWLLAAALLWLQTRSWFAPHAVHAFVVDRRPPPCRTPCGGGGPGGGCSVTAAAAAALRRTDLRAGRTPDGAGGPEEPEEPHPLRPVDRGGAADGGTDSSDPPPFATGAALAGLRADLDSLRENLLWARVAADADRVRDLTAAIAAGERRDPDLAYAAALRALAGDRAAGGKERPSAVRAWQREARRARAALPQFQLEGLWVGSYGEHGDQLINITYIGDTLIASKSTGDENVPRGQVSFTVDLSPVAPDRTPLEPLRLSLDRATGEAVVRVPRFAGRGQVAKPGFVEPAYVEGQLVLFERHLSFVWLPLRHHVLFRRPTPAETLALLRDTLAAEDELGNMRYHLERCLALDPTTPAAAAGGLLSEDGDTDGAADNEPPAFRRISFQQELDALAAAADAGPGAFRFPLWNVKKYFDRMLRDVKREPRDGPEEPRSFYEGDGI